MKITDRSPNRLRLVHFGWYYGAIAAVFGLLCLYAGLSLWSTGDVKGAAIFLGLGCGASLGLGVLATRHVTVTLDQVAGIVHIRNATAFGKRVRSAPLAQLKEAHIQTSMTGDTTLYRLVLLFHDREGWVVTRMYTTGDGTIRAMEEINQWMHRHLPKRSDEDQAQHA